MKKKVITRVFGGLGNQLFIYAAARRMAIVNNAELVLDNLSGFKFDYEYKRTYQLGHFNIDSREATAAERFEPFSRVRRYLFRYWNQYLPFDKRLYLVQEGVDFDSRLISYKPIGTLYLEGNWQSENYFKDIETQIRNDLRINPPTDSVNLQMAKLIGESNAVAVHVRFFDLPSQSGLSKGDNNAPDDYYHRAINTMELRLNNAHYFLFSDKPAVARARIKLPEDRITLVHHNQGDSMAYADLWLMSQCKHFIIANSTFSWWGAWMSEYLEKIVIAPGFKKRKGKMSWGFRGLLPERWVKL